MTTILAAECEQSDLAQLAQLGWPGVIVCGFFLAFLAFVIWVWVR